MVFGSLELHYYVYAIMIFVSIFASVAISFLLKNKYVKVYRLAFHVAKLFLIFVAIYIAVRFSNVIIVDYKLRWLAPGVVDVVTSLIVGLIILHQLSHLIAELEKTLIEKGHEPTSMKMLARTLRLIGIVLIALLVAGHYGLSMSGLLAFGGIGGIAIGMASKDMLSNVLAGVMLYFDRQFKIGDWIRSPDRNIEGTVVEIGWRLTKIMTFDHRPLFVPNALFSSISVENPGQMTNRRIMATIGLRYEDANKIRELVQAIEQMLSAHPDIDQAQTRMVYFNAFAGSSLNIMIYCFTKTTNWSAWLGVQQDVYLRVIELVKEHGADFAFPTQTIYLEGPAEKG